MENHKLPTIAFSLVLNIEAVREGDKAGYVSMAGDLLRDGTKNRTKDQIDEAIDFIGATLNTSPTGIYASSLTKHENQLLDLMTDVLYNPTFPEDELEKLKKQTLSSLATEKDDPSSIVQNVRQVLLFGKDHPYGELTTENTVKNIKIDDCKKYYEQYFSPEIAYLAIVGDINKKQAKKLVEQYFAKWQKKSVTLEQFSTPKAPAETNVALVDRPNAVQSMINISYPIDLKKGSADIVKTNVMNQILGATASSRFEKNIREDKAFTYYARSTIHSDQIAGYFLAQSEVRNPVTDSAVDQFIYEMKRIRDEQVSQGELKSAQAYIMGSFARALESPQTIATFALNTARYNLPEDYYNTYLKRVDAVTTADVEDIAKKYIEPGHSYIVVVGKASEIADGLKQFGPLKYYDMYGEEYNPETVKLPEGLTATNVIDDYIKALGGADHLKQVKDVEMTMKASIQGQELTMTAMNKAPNKALMTVKMGDNPVMKRVYDGQNISMVQMGNKMPVDDKTKQDIAFESAIFGELEYDQYGIEPKLTGIEKVDGKDTYTIEYTLPSGSKVVDYYDTDSFLKIRSVRYITTPKGPVPQSTDYSNYQEVDGIKFPFTITQPMGPGKLQAEVQSIEINKGIDDSVFDTN